MRRAFAPQLIMLAFSASPALPQAVDQREHEHTELDAAFVMGADFTKLSERSQQIYLVGVVDGIIGGPLFGLFKKDRWTWFEQCKLRNKGDRLRATVVAYLRANPDALNDHMYRVVFKAVQEPCDFTGSATAARDSSLRR